MKKKTPRLSESRLNALPLTTRRRPRRSPRRAKSLPSPTSLWTSSHGTMRLIWRSWSPQSAQSPWTVFSGALESWSRLGEFRDTLQLETFVATVSRSFKSLVSLRTTRLWWMISKSRLLASKTTSSQWTLLHSTKSKTFCPQTSFLHIKKTQAMRIVYCLSLLNSVGYKVFTSRIRQPACCSMLRVFLWAVLRLESSFELSHVNKFHGRNFLFGFIWLYWNVTRSHEYFLFL